MTAQEILSPIGQFSARDLYLFEEHIVHKTIAKNELVLAEGEICSSIYYVLSGALLQFQTHETTETIIDLHLPQEWMFNHSSLIDQKPSATTIQAFEKSEVVELSLNHLHSLMANSQAFLQLGKVFNQSNHRAYLFDNGLNPAQKYEYIQNVKPLIAQVFPVKMIASYLKIAPETLSRVRAKH